MSARDELAELLRFLAGDVVPDWALVERIGQLVRQDPQLARLVIGVASDLLAEHEASHGKRGLDCERCIGLEEIARSAEAALKIF